MRILGAVNPLSYAVDLLQLALYAPDAEGYYGATVDVIVLAVLAVAVFYVAANRPVRPDPS